MEVAARRTRTGVRRPLCPAAWGAIAIAVASVTLVATAALAQDDGPSINVTVEIEGELSLSFPARTIAECPAQSFLSEGSGPLTISTDVTSIPGSDGRDWWLATFSLFVPTASDWTVTFSTPPGATSGEAETRWQATPVISGSPASMEIVESADDRLVFSTHFHDSKSGVFPFVWVPATITIECAGFSAAAPPPLEGIAARVEGEWSVEGVVTGSSFVGTPREGVSLSEVDSSWISNWVIAPQCDSGPCDIVLTSNHAMCVLHFTGAGWSGNMVGLDTPPSDECQSPVSQPSTDEPPSTPQPIFFIVTETIDVAGEILATKIEGQWSVIEGPKSWRCCPPEWNWYVLDQKTFTATRTDLPSLEGAVARVDDTPAPPETTSTTVLAAEGSTPTGVADGPPAALQVSTLSASVLQPNEISVELSVLATNGVLAVLLVLLMPFPAEVFNRTLDENYERATGWWKRGVLSRVPFLGSGETSVWSLVVVAVAGGLLAGFLDPSFGFDLQSAAVFAGGLLAIAFVMLVTVGIERLYLSRRATEIRVSMRALPGALVVGAACVVMSRLIDFQPGYLYGVLAGLIVVGVITPQLEARSVALSYGGLALVAGASWLAWWSFQTGLTSPGFGAVVIDTFLAAVFVAGLESVVIGVMPMRFLSGSLIFKWNRLVWGVLFGLGLFAFFQLLAHPGRGYGATESSVPFLTALILFLGFGLFSVGFWAWFRFRSPSSDRLA